LELMSKPAIRVSEAEAANDFRSLLARVRSGAEVVIERNAEAVALLRPAAPNIRLLSEALRLAKERGSSTTNRGGCILRCARTPWYPRCRETNLSAKQVMTRLSLEIELPDTLAKQAKEAGLLEPDAVERMVREALLARRVESLAQAREVLAANPLPPMTPEEIQAEIDAYRSEVRRAARP
jgi:antitoxin (DNA-binding transcriptional repressor) of toxin-antitoxin stability system